MIKLKKILCIIISFILAIGCAIPSFAIDNVSNNNVINGKLKVIQYNVAGLPIPNQISDKANSVKTCQIKNAECLNLENADIIGVEEDFDYHYVLETNMNLPYKTITSGGAGVGDGLNFWSKYNIYNVGRVEWETLYGILDAGNDALTPKGILYATVEIEKGAYVDIYNIHADANEDQGSLDAKTDEFRQLSELINSHSGSRAVILMGDFNANFSFVLGDVLRERFIDDGFKDTWVEAKNDGVYNFTYADGDAKFHTHYWGHWDCLDKTLYRSGDGVTLNTVSHRYQYFGGDGTQQIYSDHAASISEIGYTIDKSQLPEDTTEKTIETFNIFDYIKSIFIHLGNALKLILTELFK